MGDKAMPEIFSPVSDDNVMRQAEVMAMRQVTATLTQVQQELVAHRTKQEQIMEQLAAVRTELAVANERAKAMTGMQTVLEAHDRRLDVLERQRAQWDGANNLVKWMKEFGPWLVSIALLFWGLFERTPK